MNWPTYIDPAWVTDTYAGKDGCACGCGGNYLPPTTPAGKARITRLNKQLNDRAWFCKAYHGCDSWVEVRTGEHRCIRIYYIHPDDRKETQ